MRALVTGLVVGMLCLPAAPARAEDDTGERVLGGVISGLLGQPQPSADAVYTAKERDRLVSLLQGGQYATSRQGEPVDAMVYGIPLTRVEHVYTARPMPTSQMSSGEIR